MPDLWQRPEVCHVGSRVAILEAVWGYAWQGETRTVDVHVHWLRRKIEDDPVRPVHIITVWQYGYKFVPRPQGGGSTVAIVEAGSVQPEPSDASPTGTTVTQRVPTRRGYQ